MCFHEKKLKAQNSAQNLLKPELERIKAIRNTVCSDFWLLNLYHKNNNKSDTKVLFLIEYSCVLSKSTRWTLQWMIFRFVDSDLWQMNLYHKHKRDTEISVLNEYEFNMNCCYMFFKGSNFYQQITHWYDFIQAWTVTHFFNCWRRKKVRWSL